jgi:hypothetical protein
MRRAVLTLGFLVLILARASAAPPPPPPAAAEIAAYRETVERLAAPDMEGRGLGSPGLDRARDFILAQLQDLSLTPAFGDSRTQSFDATLPDFVREHRQRLVGEDAPPIPAAVRAANIAVLLPGPGSRPGAEPGQLQREVIVVAAHYDHLGHGDRLTYGLSFEPVIHPGADDNASGVAAVLLLAKRLAANPPPAPRRAILLAFFTGEEVGLLGSRHFVTHLDDLKSKAFSPDFSPKILAIINLDMVGRLNDHALQILGVGTSPHWKPHLRTAAVAADLKLLLRAQPEARSDLTPFIEAKIPGVHLFTGLHEDYHRPSDTADKIDAPGGVRVVDFTEALVRTLAAGAALDFATPTQDDAE